MSNLVQRTITGFFFVAVLIFCVAYSGYSLTTLFFAISVLSLYEFYGLVKNGGYRINLFMGLGIGAVVFISFILRTYNQIDGSKLMLLFPVLLLLFLLELFRKQEKPFENIAMTILGIVYAVLPFVFFVSLGFIQGTDYNFELPLGFLLLLWSNDTFAYLFGRQFGKHRLFERISPKKSWEGFFGGMLSAVIISQIIAHYFTSLDAFNWAVVSLIIVCFGTLGDLVESMFKRSLDVKDSGSILPGHGGLLDRFDGLLLAAPFVYAYLIFLGV
ncbi:phosphatidate cytidylyltransferase [Solitalea longa]|uniref:Phosphatidate cytidylyltransferase n=1 Tax=Solitalea longa TaxID=2079460 RepID=A0A2S5A4G8_9SPHI|nr:phosphatidate cytidylyltransferase [Solitalea longa]POY37187.1 phosphatidate cytidylyltransferase [Solitalea longa]